MYRAYNSRPIPQPTSTRRSFKPVILLVIGCILVVAYVSYVLIRPLPTAHTVLTPPVSPALVKVNIPWPKSGDAEQSAYGADGYGLLASSNTIETATPTASIAKVVTALSILQQKPLKAGEQGPNIPLTAADVAIYNKYVAEDGSVVPVVAGQTMTEYQGLQAMMLPSANNIADSMAMWAFGSLPAYTNYAEGYVKKLNMDATRITDASGFAKTTVSTAPDLVKLGVAALDNPVLSSIVSESSADTSTFGTLYNTNKLLGKSGVIGIKTGNTDEAGGCFLSAANVPIGDTTVRVVTAVMAAPDLATALRDTVPLIQTTPSQFQTVHIVRANQSVGTITTAWGASSTVIAAKDINTISWSGTTLPALTSTSDLHIPTKATDTVGSLSLDVSGTTKTTDLKLARPLNGPSLWWRLTHPL